MTRLYSTFAALVLLSLSAAANPSGTWRSEEGETGGYVVVAIAPCASDASKICGTI